MRQINDLARAFVRCTLHNITVLFESEPDTPSGRGLTFLSQEHGVWLLDNIHHINEPKIFGAMILFSPISTGILDHVLNSYNTYSDAFIAGCFDKSLTENLCRPQSPSTYTFLEKLHPLIHRGAVDSSPSK